MAPIKTRNPTTLPTMVPISDALVTLSFFSAVLSGLGLVGTLEVDLVSEESVEDVVSDGWTEDSVKELVTCG